MGGVSRLPYAGFCIRFDGENGDIIRTNDGEYGERGGLIARISRGALVIGEGTMEPVVIYNR